MNEFVQNKYRVIECSFSKVEYKKVEGKFPLKVSMSVSCGKNKTKKNIFAARATTNIKSEHLPFVFTIAVEIFFRSEGDEFSKFVEWTGTDEGQTAIETSVSDIIDSMLRSFGYPAPNMKGQE